MVAENCDHYSGSSAKVVNCYRAARFAKMLWHPPVSWGGVVASLVTRCAIGAFVVALLLSSSVTAQSREMRPVSIPTRWAKAVTPDNVWPEYPRPQMVRANWQNLNGLWDYAITDRKSRRPKHYQGQILVPFPVESALSGVASKLRPDQRLWYRRTFTRPH